MSSGTPTNVLKLHKYAQGDPFDYTEVNADNAVLDTLPPTKCTSDTRPTTNLYQGRLIYETDTQRLLMWSTAPSSAWYMIGDAAPWTTFTPKAYKDAGGTPTVISGTTVNNAKFKYLTPKTVCAIVDITIPTATAGGITVDLPVSSKDRILNAGTAALFGTGTPADQSGIAYMSGTKDKIHIVAYTQGFRDAAAGNIFRYNVTYEVP